MPTRDYLFYALTNSVCSKCLTKVEAKIIFRDDGVYLVKHCPAHGHEEVLIADDIVRIQVKNISVRAEKYGNVVR